MVRAGGRHRPCARQGRRSAHAAFPRVPRLNFTDTRNRRPTSDVTVTLDGATSSPQPVRFVRHRTLAESFQHASRVRRGSHRRTAAAAEARRRAPTSRTTTTRRRRTAWSRRRSATWRTRSATTRAGTSRRTTRRPGTTGSSPGTRAVWRRGSFSARRRRRGPRRGRCRCRWTTDGRSPVGARRHDRHGCAGDPGTLSERPSDSPLVGRSCGSLELDRRRSR